MNEAAHTHQIVILCSDMLFLSKITGVAKLLGFSFCTALSSKKAAEYLTEEGSQLILIDLTTPNLNWELLASIHHRNPHLVSIAFGPHVDTDLLEQAKAAGCTQVLPRSKFSAQLPQLLQAAFESDQNHS
ncbi:MAG: hypothetical protein ABIK07_22615 [Planctomycetota bacterium]|jgi:CheY-like chemotaxis protein|uniref:hypothetical protein n=1 Tax=uncultured Gimesia sp. TaxID=1678688 RepID=UPI00261BCC91|nr:hypothetical protein [uncultured Gimesia sp.]